MSLSFSVVKENILEAGSRVLKVIQFGPKTANVVSSFGDDSAPLKDMVAIYAETSEVGDSVIIGYINKDQISKPGEKRIFSLKEDGSLSTQIYLKNNGILEIAEAEDFAVRFTPLNTAITDKDALIQSELVKIATAINAIAPGSYTPGAIITNANPSRVDNVKI